MTVVASYFWLNGHNVRGYPELLDGVARPPAPESVIVFRRGSFLEAACIVISSQVIHSTALSTIIKELYKLPASGPDPPQSVQQPPPQPTLTLKSLSHMRSIMLQSRLLYTVILSDFPWTKPVSSKL